MLYGLCILQSGKWASVGRFQVVKPARVLLEDDTGGRRQICNGFFHAFRLWDDYCQLD